MGEPGQDCQDMTAASRELWTRASGLSSYNRTAGTGQHTAGQDSWYTVEKLGQDSWDKTTGTGQPGQQSWDRRTRTGKSERQKL
jgi:hypothetical protein